MIKDAAEKRKKEKMKERKKETTDSNLASLPPGGDPPPPSIHQAIRVSPPPPRGDPPHPPSLPQAFREGGEVGVVEGLALRERRLPPLEGLGMDGDQRKLYTLG